MKKTRGSDVPPMLEAAIINAGLPSWLETQWTHDLKDQVKFRNSLYL